MYPWSRPTPGQPTHGDTPVRDQRLLLLLLCFELRGGSRFPVNSAVKTDRLSERPRGWCGFRGIICFFSSFFLRMSCCYFHPPLIEPFLFLSLLPCLSTRSLALSLCLFDCFFALKTIPTNNIRCKPSSLHPPLPVGGTIAVCWSVSSYIKVPGDVSEAISQNHHQQHCRVVREAGLLGFICSGEQPPGPGTRKGE